MTMNQKQKDRILEVIKLCNEKIQDQKDHESSAGYGEDYTDGRIVGGAALARRILDILKGFQI
jgi:hypothetical protein